LDAISDGMAIVVVVMRRGGTAAGFTGGPGWGNAAT
jgi:hypothetical protein